MQLKLYFSDNVHATVLTPVEFTKIVGRMVEDQEIVKVESRYFDYPQTKYLPLRTRIQRAQCE